MANKQRRASTMDQTIFSGQIVNQNAPTSFGHLLPTGLGVFDAWLRFTITLTAGTASGAITNGILDYFREITWKADNGETFVDALPARALIEMANVLYGTLPKFDQIAATDGTYHVHVPIQFAPKPSNGNIRPIDTILDLNRYNSTEFDVKTGPATDLFSSPGTASMTVTADLVFTHSKDEWNSKANPVAGYICYSARPPVDASNDTFIDMERADDIRYLKAFVFSGTSGASGRKWYGTSSDAIIDQMTIEDSKNTHAKNLIWDEQQRRNKLIYELESTRTGVAVIDFVRDASNFSSLYSYLNGLQLNWTNQGTPSSNSYVTLATQALRKTRPDRISAAAQTTATA